jgi:hypothetical protein
MAVTATFEVEKKNKTNSTFTETPDNDTVGIPTKPGQFYPRDWVLAQLAEENGGGPVRRIRLTIEAVG